MASTDEIPSLSSSPSQRPLFKLPCEKLKHVLQELQEKFIADFCDTHIKDSSTPIIVQCHDVNSKMEYCSVCKIHLEKKNRTVTRHIFSREHCASIVRLVKEKKREQPDVDSAIRSLVAYCYLPCPIPNCQGWLAARDDEINKHLSSQHSDHELETLFKASVTFHNEICSMKMEPIPSQQPITRKHILEPYHPRQNRDAIALVVTTNPPPIFPTSNPTSSALWGALGQQK